MQNTGYYIILMVVGLILVVISVANRDFVFKQTRARLDVKLLGRTGARIVYFIFGSAAFLFGLGLITGFLTI